MGTPIARFSAGFVSLLLLLCGCNPGMQEQDQLGMRHALLHLYEDQIIDNLYRTYNGLPVVQVDYPQMVGTTGLTYAENTGGGQNTGLGLAPGATNGLQSVLIPISNTYNWALGLSSTQSRQIALTANPVTVTTLNGFDDLYSLYLKYLFPNPEDGSLQDFLRPRPAMGQMSVVGPPSPMIPSPDSPPTDVYADSAWKHGNPLDLSRVRLMITSEEPEEGDYLGSFVLAVDRGHHKKQYYWIPDWPRSEAGNRTRTEFFILCRLVTVTRRQSAPIQPFVGGQTVGQPGQNFNSPENSIRSANSPPPATAPTTLPDDRK